MENVNKKIRFATLGIGGRGQGLTWLYATHPEIEFVAFADIATNRAADTAAEFNKQTGADVKAFNSYEELIKGASFDALLIGCDPDLQVDYACDAMERGIHVMTEVPAAYSIAQCRKLVDTVRKTGAKYQLAEQTRYWSFIRKWREMSERGDFGKIYYAEGEYLHYEPVWDNFREKATNYSLNSNDPKYFNDPDYIESWRCRTFRNPLFYLPHELSPLLSITGGRIARVCAFGTREGSYATEGMPFRDLEAALMYNTDDVLFSVRAGFSAPYGPKRETGAHWYQIKGTKQTVEWARSTVDMPKLYKAGGEWEEHPEWSCMGADDPEYIRNSSHGGADFFPILYFADAIINDKTPPMDVYRAVESAAPAILAVESAQKGGVMLEVPDFRL